MHSNSSDSTNNKTYFQPLKNEKENIICKDGFCSISNPKETSKIDKNDKSLFDPI